MISCRDMITGSERKDIRPDLLYLRKRTLFECGNLGLSIGTDLWDHPFWSQGRLYHMLPQFHTSMTHPRLEHNKTRAIHLSTGPESLKSRSIFV
ncbi:hypothetical protein EC991_002202 [Linnemannia zychae]|nr:hypothetical protein EC991_002202 [Linnemannia zychae]